MATIATFANKTCNDTGTLRDEFVASVVDAYQYDTTQQGVADGSRFITKVLTVGVAVSSGTTSSLVSVITGTPFTIPAGALIERVDVVLGKNGALGSVSFQLGYFNTALNIICAQPSPPGGAVAAQAALATFITGSSNSVKSTVLNYNKRVRFFARLNNAQITTATVGENAIYSNLVPAPSAPVNADYNVLVGLVNCAGEAQPIIPCLVGTLGTINPGDVYVSITYCI